MNCINPKLIKPVADKYNVSAKDMETATYLYQLQYNLDTYDENDPNFDSFVKDYFKIDTQSEFNSKFQYEVANKLWNKTKDGIIEVNDENEESLYNKLATAFGNDKLIRFTNSDGNKCIRLTKPIYKENEERANLSPYQESIMSELRKRLMTYAKDVKWHAGKQDSFVFVKEPIGKYNGKWYVSNGSKMGEKQNGDFGKITAHRDTIKNHLVKWLTDQGIIDNFNIYLNDTESHYIIEPKTTYNIPEITVDNDFNEVYLNEDDTYEGMLKNVTEKLFNDSKNKNLRALFGNKQTATAKEILTNMIKLNSAYKELAEKLLPRLGKLAEIPIQLTDANYLTSSQEDGSKKQVAGLYHNTNFIEISNQLSENFTDGTILHEIVHAIIYNNISKGEFAKEFTDLFNDTKEKILKKYNVNSIDEIEDAKLKRALYGLTSEDEFVSEYLTNQSFINEINDIDKSFLQKLLNLIKSIFTKNKSTSKTEAEKIKNLVGKLITSYNGEIAYGSNRKGIASKNEAASEVEIQETIKQNIEKVTEFCKQHFRFNEKETTDKDGNKIPAHSYSLIDKDGNVIKTTDKTASSAHYDGNGKFSIKPKTFSQEFEKYHKIPSTTLGSTVDQITRDFFSDNLQKSYPNFTNEDLYGKKGLISQLQKLKAYGDKVGLTFISADFPMMANINGNLIGGTMDLLVYDKQGNVYIYDMKNKRSFNNETTLNNQYKGQQNVYKAMLEGISKQIGYPIEIKGMKILQFNTFYPYTDSWEIDDNGQLTCVDPVVGERKSVQLTEQYIPTKILLNEDGSPLNFKIKDIVSDLTDEEKQALFGEVEINEISNSIKNADDTNEVEVSSENESINTLYSSGIKGSDITELANSVINTLSDIFDQLCNGNVSLYYKIQNKPVPSEDSEEYKRVKESLNFNRDDVIRFVSLDKVLNFIKERHFGFYLDKNEEDFQNQDDKELIRTMKIGYENFDALLAAGYSRLIMLENKTIVPFDPEELHKDTEQDSETNLEDVSNKDVEHWAKSLESAKSSLSQEWRKILSKIKDLDKDGKQKYNKFQFKQFLDENVVINNLLSWFKDCTTVEEMEKILEQKSNSYFPAYGQILNIIRNDQQLRSKFFQNFRKDFQTYSITIANYDKATGKYTFINKTINTCTATEYLSDALSYKFAVGFPLIDKLFKVDGNTRSVNQEYNRELTNKAITVKNMFTKKEDLLDTTKVAALEDLLKEYGIEFPETTVQQALEDEYLNNKSISNNFKDNSIVFEIINNLDSVRGRTTKSIQTNNTVYSFYKEKPKNNQISIRNNYNTVLNIFAPFLEEVVEASTFENGKSHYAFNPPSYTGKLFINLEKCKNDPEAFKAFLNKEYDKYKWFSIDNGTTYLCPILSMLNEKDYKGNLTSLAVDARNWLAHKTQLSYRKTPYVELSGLSYMHSVLTEFFANSSDKEVVKANYRVPIMSNKPSSEFISMPRFKGSNYKETMGKYFFNVFQQELMRMRTILERATKDNVEEIKNFDIDKKKNAKLIKKLKAKSISSGITQYSLKSRLTLDDLKSLKKSGASFKFLTFLNDFDNSELNNHILNYLNGVEELPEDIPAFYDVLNSSMSNITKEQIKYIESLGLKETTKSRNGKPFYKYFSFLSINENMTAEEQNAIIDRELENFVWNDMLAAISTIELTATDLAYYKNMEDFQKRYAQIHAPGLRLNTTAEATIKDKSHPQGSMRKVSDGISRTITIKDFEHDTGIEEDTVIAFDKLIKMHPERKDSLEVMKGVVSAALKGVNVADAQAFTSPTGMMKKLVMAGSWTNDMMKAYDRIKEGNFDLSDLQVFIQPLKPFVYSQIEKNSYVDTMPTLKVGLQNKNSEYMILLADAIIRGAKSSSKLTALFDFMESTAYDANGNYTGKGIDTIQFESAVKVGLEGVIDINNLGYNDIIKTLNNRIHSDINEYDDRYVHSFPYEDYAIQQEVPAHLRDHRQLLGSQERILTVSDMPFDTQLYFKSYDGTEKHTAGELIQRYQDLIKANIEDSFNQLAEQFGLNNTNRIERNKLMSKLLSEEIKKDARYGADLHRACMLDNNGEFIIPLSDPIQATRIQQLIHSIIKKNINKQKIAGGPVVQATSWGISKGFKIRYKDEKGNLLKTRDEFETSEEYKKYLDENLASLAYFECAMPVPTSELEKDLYELAKKIDGDSYNGRLATPQEAIKYGLISDEQLKSIGYRIPTEDKYSIYPMKITAWVPKFAGEVIMLPEEITKLTGSDFDIDKTYIILKEFYKSDRRRVKNSKRDDIIKRIQLKFKDFTVEQAEQLLNDWEENNGKGINFSEKNAINKFANISAVDAIIASDPEALLPNYRQITKNNRQGRNNEIFDIQWTMLTHPDTMDKMFNPGSFDPQKKTAAIVRCLENNQNKKEYIELAGMKLEDLEDYLSEIESNNAKNILHISTQVQFFQQNMVAGKLIGIFANNNVSHAFVQMQNVSMNFDENAKLEFDGIELKNEVPLDRIFANDNKTYISKNIAGFLAASVDAVKDPVLNYLNLNTFTAGPAMVLARLGFDVDSIGLFFSQPIIKEATIRFTNANNDGYKTGIQVVSEMLQERYGDNWYKDIQNHVAILNKGSLARNIQKGNSTFDNEVLRTFYFLLRNASALGDLTFITKFNSVTNAAGPTIADNIMKQRRIKKFESDMDSENPPFSKNIFDVLTKSPILSAFYDYTLGSKGSAEDIFKPWFLQYTGQFDDLINLWERYTKAPLDETTINQLVNEFLLYKMTYKPEGENAIFDMSDESRSYYINRFPSDFVNAVKNDAELQNNELIKIIKLKVKNQKCPVDTLEANVSGYSASSQETIRNAWTDLITSSNENHKKLGKQLFEYCLMRNGFGFSPKTFIHLASVDTKLAIGYTTKLNDLSFNNEVSVDDFIISFKRNHSDNKRIVPNFDKISDLPNGSHYEEYNGNKELIVTCKKENADSFTTTYGAVNMIKVANQLYELIDFDKNTYLFKYRPIESLGSQNNFLEYNANDPNIMSAIKKSSEDLDITESDDEDNYIAKDTVQDTDVNDNNRKPENNTVDTDTQSKNISTSLFSALKVPEETVENAKKKRDETDWCE